MERTPLTRSHSFGRSSARTPPIAAIPESRNRKPKQPKHLTAAGPELVVYSLA